MSWLDEIISAEVSKSYDRSLQFIFFMTVLKMTNYVDILFWICCEYYKLFEKKGNKSIIARWMGV